MTAVDQRQYWTRDGVDEWLQHEDRFEAMAKPFGRAMLESARLRPGEWVLDVGCGTGTTTMDAARLIGPVGVAVGADISPLMLSRARQRAACSGLRNVEFIEADAERHGFAVGGFDVVISRFGTMFFADPAAAFANLARAVRPGGRLAVVVSQDPLQTELIAVAMAAAVPHVGLPDLGGPGDPGQFAFADGASLVRIVQTAGFGHVHLEPIVRPVQVGSDVDDTVSYLAARPEARSLFERREPAQVRAAIDAVHRALVPYAGPMGVVMDDAAWLVTAIR